MFLGLERLPEEKKAKFKELHMNRNISWKERQRLVNEEIKSESNVPFRMQQFHSELPEQEQRLVEPPHMPPPGFMGQGFHGAMMPPMGPPPFGHDLFPPRVSLRSRLKIAPSSFF